MKNFIYTIIKSLREKYRNFAQKPSGKKTIRYGSYFFQLAVICFILYQLTSIGWETFFSSLPTHPVYYLLFLLIYSLLPFTEALAYKKCWNIPYLKSIPIFLKKRIFNKDVMGFSGEIVLLGWARDKLDYRDKKLLKDIRDNNIVSSAASSLVAFSVLLIFIATGQIPTDIFLPQTGFFNYFLFAILASIIILLAIRFRKYLFSMKHNIAGYIFTLHSIRMILIYISQIFQWYIVMPEIGLDVWYTFLSINIIISRIPLLPNNELIATGTNIEIAKLIEVPVAGVAGLLLVHNVLDKLLNAVIYMYFSLTKKTEGTKYDVQAVD